MKCKNVHIIFYYYLIVDYVYPLIPNCKLMVKNEKKYIIRIRLLKISGIV